MAKDRVTGIGGITKSPLGIARIRVRRGKMRRSVAPPGLEQNEKLYDMVIEHMLRLCKVQGCVPNLVVPSMVPVLAGKPLPPSRAWEWLFYSFEAENLELLASDEGLRLCLAFARGRVYAMWEDERRRFAKLQLSKDAGERQRLYASERAANGGELDFFRSNTWQRLRFEVLADADGCCVLCGRSYRDHGVALEVDHIKPRSRFPDLSLDRDNLQVLCFDCNRGKGNRDTTDWRPDADNDATDELAA